MGTYKRKSKQIKVHDPVSTLLIPVILMGYFLAQVQKHGSRRKYFQHLLYFYSSHLQEHPLQNKEKLTTRYQEPGQKLQAFSFRSKALEWQSFKCLARMNGVSMTYLFVYLMELEMHGIAPNRPRSGFVRQKILGFCRRFGFRKVATTPIFEEIAIFHANHYEKFGFFGFRIFRKGKISFA